MKKFLFTILVFCAIVDLKAQVTTTGTSAGTLGTLSSYYGINAGMNATALSMHNVFIGAESGKLNTTGSYNTFNRYQAGYSNSEGQYNIYLGYKAGYSANTLSSSYNICIGRQSGYLNSSGSNILIGSSSGYSNSGTNNICIGSNSGYNNKGNFNTFIGIETGYSNSNTNGINNFYAGYQTGRNATGQNNVFVGTQAGYNSTTGNQNTFIGTGTGFQAVGSNNVYLGRNAGRLNQGSGNVFIGWNAGSTATALNNTFILSNNSTDLDKALLYGDFTNKTLGVGGAVPSGFSFYTWGRASLGGATINGTASIYGNTNIGGSVNIDGGDVIMKNYSKKGLSIYTNDNTYTNDYPDFSVRPEGVSIGGVKPQEHTKLTIGNPGLDSYTIISTSTVYGTAIKAEASSYMGTIGYSGHFTGGQFVIDHNIWDNDGQNTTIPSFIVNNDGNVSIGTNTVYGTTGDLYKLSVNGKIACKELKVDSKWADFVFEKNYKLRSLTEVESFIKTNKHLPEIPSAAEVEKNGASVGEMQSKMMQKIEELTLYIIEQQKQIESLKNEIKNITK